MAGEVDVFLAILRTCCLRFVFSVSFVNSIFYIFSENQTLSFFGSRILVFPKVLTTTPVLYVSVLEMQGLGSTFYSEKLCLRISSVPQLMVGGLRGCRHQYFSFDRGGVIMARKARKKNKNKHPSMIFPDHEHPPPEKLRQHCCPACCGPGRAVPTTVLYAKIPAVMQTASGAQFQAARSVCSKLLVFIYMSS